MLNELPYVSTFALVLVTPFEKVQPLFSLAAMNFTNVEAVVLAALIVWSACLLLQRQLPRLRTEVTLPALLLLGVMIVSTLTASAYRGEALCFCGRFLAGLIVCLLIANVVTNRRRFHGILIAAGLSGAIVATISIVEHQQLPGVWSWLQSYKQGAFFVGGQLRSSSTLQYPTITSMYLEMVFGLGVSLLLLAMERRWPILLLILLIALGLVTQGMILSLTRAGIISMVAMLILGTGLWWIERKVDCGFWVLLGLVGLVGCLHVQALLQDPFYRLRLTKTQDK